MASTDQVRKWYNETVSNHDDRGKAGFEPKCNWAIAETVKFPREGGGFFSEPVHPATVEAWEAYIKAMVHFGETMPGSGGVNSCRNIADTDWPSLHAYLVAVDLPPNSRKSDEFQAAVLGIKTNSGANVFRNLDSINDRMHDQIDCSPSDLATGINWDTVPGEGEDMELTRHSKADDGNPDLAGPFAEMVEMGVMSKHTQPGGVAFNDEVATFLVRFMKALAETTGVSEARVKEIIANTKLSP